MNESIFSTPEPLEQVIGPAEEAGGHETCTHESRKANLVMNRRGETEPLNPQTYQQAVEAVIAINETIRKSVATKNDDAAHGPLHKISRILEEINLLAAEGELTGAQRQSVHISVAKLSEAFRVVDGTMHGEEGLCYEEVSLEIEENLEILKGIFTI